MIEINNRELEPVNEIHVIPVTGFRNDAGRFEHRLPPLSATTRAEEYLDGHSDVHLSVESIRRLVQGAVEPQQLDGIRIERHRVETGWLMVISYRAYSPMVSLAIENDRLLAEASYAADPAPAENRIRPGGSCGRGRAGSGARVFGMGLSCGW